MFCVDCYGLCVCFDILLVWFDIFADCWVFVVFFVVIMML